MTWTAATGPRERREAGQVPAVEAPWRQHPCACGCGERVGGRLKYLPGHKSRAAALAALARREARRATPRVVPGRQPRQCLRCERRFLSEGAHHRLCATCRSALAHEGSPAAIYRFGAGQGRVRRR